MISRAVDRSIARWRAAAAAPRVRLALEATLVYACAFGVLHAYQFLTPHLSEPDLYYHIKTAWLLRTQGSVNAFPWAATSLWREAYFNKDFGFHALLTLFTFGSLAHGAKLAAVVLGSAVVTSFYSVLRLSGVRFAWLATLCLFACGALFAYRLNVARPHLLSIILSLWIVFFATRRAWLVVGLSSLVYALCYTAPHVAVGYALVAYVAWGLGRGEWRHRLPLAAAAGVLGGWLLHPSFPNNFAGFWLQSVEVLEHVWWAENLRAGVEFEPASTRAFLVGHAPIYVAALGALWLWPRLPDRRHPRLVTLFVIANGYFVLACASKRFVEYFVPFSLWLLAEIASAALPQWSALAPHRRRGLGIAVAAALSLALVMTGRDTYRTFASFRPSAALPVAEWLYANTPHESLVFTCDWDDAPELFFFNHRNRYLVFLDPIYMFAWRPALFRAWRLIGDGLEADPVRAIRDGFGAGAGYCTGEYARLRAQLERDPRVQVAAAPGGGFMFVLTQPTAPEPTPAAP
ncbi:MAG: hypothetical protein HY903_16630 [Deltaproteobacteria bacterium]|nr:hypothetical protein [Deltaproteobacteria bacterium]